KAVHTGDIGISAKLLNQLESMTQNRIFKVLLDGTTEVTADGVYTCKYVDIANTYDISNLASVVDYLKAHAGSSTQPMFNDPSIDSDMRFCITYRYAGNGAVTVYHTIRTYKDVALGYVGFMQAAPLFVQSGSGRRLWQYIPKTKPVVGKLKAWNFQTMEDITDTIETLSLGTDSWSDADNPPERFAQLVKTVEGVTSHGFLMGYSQLRGIGVPAIRKTLVNNAFFLYVSRKQYPHGIDNGMTGLVNGRLPADSYFEAVGYRCWINPAIDPDATVCTWYMDGNDIVLVLDYHKNLKMHQVALPAQFVGKTITAVDVSASTTVHSRIVSNDGLLISVSGGYGYAVLRLS
ncbi:MAG: hypothetical protein PHT33_07250, partial [bacterium]|nr:hypothetical protein [bacterium]